ncbi:MAG: hypothetical protein IKB04_09230 [Clostridia bacterium]|nr:hypothetical protein [Clostridia bacterium]MBR2407200.1 hypothetical protein [Clostridia bacterium]
MSKYITQAAAEADAYEKQRKQQAAANVEQINAAYEQERQAAVDVTADAIRDEQRTALSQQDMAAVQKQITMKQVRERVANQGLTASGYEHAGEQAAAVTAQRRTQAAENTRDEAVRKLTEALAREEAALESKRAAAVLKEENAAEKDSADNRAALMKAAYAADAKAQSGGGSGGGGGSGSGSSGSSGSSSGGSGSSGSGNGINAGRAEENRRKGLLTLYEEGAIPLTMYTLALDQGWSVEETLQRKEEYVRTNTIVNRAVEIFTKDGFEAAMRSVAPYQLNDEQRSVLCKALGVPRVRIDEWLNGYQTFIDGNPKVQEVLGLFEEEVPYGQALY